MGDTIQPLAVSHPHPLTLINGVPISPAFSSQYLHFSARRLSRKPVLSPIRQAGSAGEFTPPQGRPPPPVEMRSICKYLQIPQLPAPRGVWVLHAAFQSPRASRTFSWLPPPLPLLPREKSWGELHLQNRLAVTPSSQDLGDRQSEQLTCPSRPPGAGGE